MPCASAPKAPCVEVWLSPQTMVVPGSVKPCSGPMTWTMPWRRSRSSKYSMPKSRAFSASVSTCDRRFGIVDALRAVGRRNVVIDDGERLLRRADLAAGDAQALEGLRARHLVHEMAVDVEEAGAVRLGVDDMVVPDLVVEGAGLAHGSCPAGANGSLRSLALIGRREKPRSGAGGLRLARAAAPGRVGRPPGRQGQGEEARNDKARPRGRACNVIALAAGFSTPRRRRASWRRPSRPCRRALRARRCGRTCRGGRAGNRASPGGRRRGGRP